MAPLFDFDGEPRPQDGYFDIGADEEELCTLITELDLTETVFDLGINPNPSSGIVIITYKQVEKGKVTLNVINQKGELLKTYSLENQNPGKHTMNLDLSHLPNGLYLIRLQSGNSVETAKIILHK